MAKSIRSKSKRRMRCMKRQRLAPRVLKKLHETVSNLNPVSNRMEVDHGTSSVAMASIFLFFEMEVDGTGFNLKTMKKPDGSYPVWLSQRIIKKKKKRKKTVKKKCKRS
ncbi:unnamed protein product [Thelazia callipaeda]|uniref:50S ribosomal protein L18 n=1 Tax=Thelazia callipaeda TaxID=103827 RepID=A0A0N5D9L9_THECL|nr:unnamed protein product [Thelazia callipaeda]